MDNLLMPELRRLHEILRQEEAMLSLEERRKAHMEFVKHCEEIIKYSDVSRKEGLIALEDLAEEKGNDPQWSFDRELIFLIVNGYDPEMIKRIILPKYFSTEQTTTEIIKNIMSIYGILSVQAGENPIIISKLLNNMIPDDVRAIAENIGYQERRLTEKKEVNIDDYCKGDFRIQEKDLGYFEAKLCEDVLLGLSNTGIQRVLQETANYTIVEVMGAFSGKCRRHIFNNLSKSYAQDLASKLRQDDASDTSTYYLHSDFDLKRIREAAIRILSLIQKLESAAEIVICAVDTNVRFFRLFVEMIRADEDSKKSKEKECNLLISAINDYKRYGLESYYN